ncbi:MAG: family 10 glycosylhydrolase [Microcoleaceae cyanobacterium]
MCWLLLGFAVAQVHAVSVPTPEHPPIRIDSAPTYPSPQVSQAVQDFLNQAQPTLDNVAQSDTRIQSEEILNRVQFGLAELSQSAADNPDLQVLLNQTQSTLAERKTLFWQRLNSLGERLQAIRSQDVDLEQKLQHVSQALQSPAPIVESLELANLSTLSQASFANSHPITHQREFRGVWAASVVNIDWPSKAGLPVTQQKFELLALLNRMTELNLNALVLQIRPNGDALYASTIEPWSSWLTGTQGKPPEPYYDPLQFAIEECHKRNIELHAWFNPYRARLKRETSPFAANHMAVQYPQYAYRYGDLIWMDPGAREIQERTYQVILDVVQRYDVDGIHLDDYFYPYPVAGVDFPDSQTYGAYRAAGGTLSLADWRRQNVNVMIQQIANGIKSIKPYVKFGISPFGIYRPGQAPGIEGMDQYSAIYADVKLWMEQGWVDYLAPQLYWPIDPPQQSYPVLLNWWLGHNPVGRHIYTGNFLSKINTEWPISEIERQVAISRQGAGKLSLGNIFFSMKVFRDNSKGVNEVFKTSVYPSPALVPPMPWLDNTPPDPPTGVQASAGILTWNPPNSTETRSWALYQLMGNTWALRQVFNVDTTAVRVAPGTYAIRAVDRMANESAEQVVLVQ